MLTTLLSFIFVLGLLIFVHELGHFLTAKMVGIRVERFSLGFPPRMIGKKIGDTDYCISWLPLGGYVKMAGMIDESLDDTLKGEPWEYQSKTVWQRIIVISAGSIMNFLAAIVIYSMIAGFSGIPEPHGALVSEVFENKPADVIGLQEGDVIVAVDNNSVRTHEDLISVVNANPDVEVSIEWVRDEQAMSAMITPERETERDIGLIGVRIGNNIIYRDANALESMQHGVVTSYTFLEMTIQHLGMIISGKESFKDAVGGPIIIAKLAGESAKLGFQSLLAFTAFISLNLGFFNMLPLPVLDGGHLVLLLIEGIMGKPLPIKTRMTIQKVGMAFLLALMIFIIINDITRFGKFSF
jgi:regulator of sigma E protease